MTLEQMRRQDGFAGKGDDFYEALLAAHEGLDDKESAALNARLVLLLANHIGSLPALREALSLARAGVRPAEATIR
jgi:Protein of unknown function (DUF2783)